ncbi:MAG TPA: hypothetical protein VFQ50_08955 [Flavobacterium sp.]|nr:hypothetical protein [Flavobacterium sp.]
MKTSKKRLLAAMFGILLTISSCKQDNPDGYDVGAGTGNSETYNDRGAGNSGGTTDHPGQNIGSNRDSTTVQGEPGKPSNY